MIRFERAMAFVERWEGGFFDDPRDPGGATNYGISLRFLRSLAPELGDTDGDGDVDADDVMALTPAGARELYRYEFWDRLQLNDVTVPMVAAMLIFDAAVNMGRERAMRIGQETLRSFGCAVDVDGVMGPQTRAALSRACLVNAEGFVDRFCLQRIRHYSAIVEARASMARFLRGWANRAVALAEAARKEA